MYLKREIDRHLEAWASESGRKPLLLRGARQIGKTTAVRHLAEKFESFIEINFEDDAAFNTVFNGDFDIPKILAAIELKKRTKIVPGKTLLFLDEIQLCPRAISCLRYFYEKMPELHVVATGSLLEFAFGEIADFGVGRIRNMFMHPMSFAEFVSAMGAEVSLERARDATFASPLFPDGHEMMLDYLKSFLIVGGMPAAVCAFAQTKSLLAAQEQHRDILVSLKADFGKYKKRIPAARIVTVFNSVIDQTGRKFTYSDSKAGLSYAQAKDCATLLEMARLIYRVDSCHANGIPLGADVKANDNKFLPLDTGLYLTASGLDISDWILEPPAKFINRGALAEMFTGHELVKAASPFDERRLFFWHREARNSNAEVDYVVQFRNCVLPIEVKSGVKGSMKSLRIIMEEKKLSLGVRTSAENFGSIDNVRIIPLYRIGEYDAILRAAQ